MKYPFMGGFARRTRKAKKRKAALRRLREQRKRNTLISQAKKLPAPELQVLADRNNASYDAKTAPIRLPRYLARRRRRAG